MVHWIELKYKMWFTKWNSEFNVVGNIWVNDFNAKKNS